MTAQFLPHCSDKSTMSELCEMAADRSTWRTAHNLFNRIRAKTLKADRSKNRRLQYQYSFEEICAKTLYNLADHSAGFSEAFLPPFDEDSPDWVVPLAIDFARDLGLTKLHVGSHVIPIEAQPQAPTESIAQLTTREKWVELLRWVGLLPMAVIVERAGDFLTYFLVGQVFLNRLGHEGFHRWERHIFGGLLGGAAFVITGTLIAPRHRRATAVVLAAGAIALAILIHGPRHHDVPPIVAETIAVAFGVVYVFKTQKPG